VLIAAVIALPSAAAQDTPRSLSGRLVKVEAIADQLSKDPLVGVKVTVNGHDTDVTIDQGHFRVHLPASIKAGQEVELTIDRKDLVIFSPLFGRQRIPGSPDEIVEVRTMPKGSMAFWTPERFEEFITRTANESAKQVKGPQSGETDLSAVILELARHYGFTPEEVRREIGKWVEEARKDVTDFRKQGMADFAEKRFLRAGDNFGRSADKEQSQGAEKFRKSAADRQLQGDSYYDALHFERALKAYQTALKALNVYHDGLGDLGLKIYPEYTTDLQNLSFKIANAKIGLGERVAGPDSQRYLEEASQALKGQVTQVPRSSNPQQWARTQDNLGLALWALGKRLGGAEGQRRLSEAVSSGSSELP